MDNGQHPKLTAHEGLRYPDHLLLTDDLGVAAKTDQIPARARWMAGTELVSYVDKLHLFSAVQRSRVNRKTAGLICSMHRGAMPRTL